MNKIRRREVRIPPVFMQLAPEVLLIKVDFMELHLRWKGCRAIRGIMISLILILTVNVTVKPVAFASCSSEAS